MTKKAPFFKLAVAALLLLWLLVQVAGAVVDPDLALAAVSPDGLVYCMTDGDCSDACHQDKRFCGEVTLVTRETFSNVINDPNNKVIPRTTGSGGQALSGSASSSLLDSSSPTAAQASGQTASGQSASGQLANGRSANVSAIVGGVVGGAAFLALLGTLLFFCLRRHPNSDAEDNYRSVVALDKSRASWPTSMSPVYGGARPPPAVAPLTSGSPPPAELPSAPAPLGPSAPAELL